MDFDFYFFNKDLLSLCLIRPLQAGCTDPVSQPQLVSWIQQVLQTSKLRPHLSQHLCHAMPLHVMIEQAIHGSLSLCKKNNFTHHFPMPLHIDHNSTVGPHTTQTRMPQSSVIQMPLIAEAGHRHRDQLIALSTHMNGKNKTGISEMPSRHRDQEERSEELSSPGALRDCKEECKLSWWGEDRKSK